MFASHSKIKVNTSNSISKSKSKELNKSLKIAKGLFASFMLFTLCWLPYGMIVMTDFQDRLPRSAQEYSMLVAHLNSSLNPLLYAMFNPAFQRGYLKLLSCLFCRSRTDSRHDSSVELKMSTVQTKPEIID